MMRIDEIFEVRYGHSLELNRLKPATSADGYPFISRKMGDNGVSAYVFEVPGVKPNPKGELTCALSGNGVLSTFIQERPYYTAFHVACLRPKLNLSKSELLYYCACIKANRYRYSYGRQANRTLRDLLVPSPADIPSWVEKINLLQFDGSDKPVTTGRKPNLNVSLWREFKLSELFYLRKGKRLTKAKMVSGFTPFIGAIDNNNGVTSFVAQEALHDGNTISVNYNGNGVAEAFYQPVPYRCSDDVNVLYPNFTLTPLVAMFLATVIRQEKYRFNYGRKWHLERMAQSQIRLPTTTKGRPDWALMEIYIKTLPFSSQVA